MNISTANHVITIQIQNSNIPFKYQVNLPRNTPVGLPKAFQRKTNWKYWIKYIKPIWCPQHSSKIIASSSGTHWSARQTLPSWHRPSLKWLLTKWQSLRILQVSMQSCRVIPVIFNMKSAAQHRLSCRISIGDSLHWQVLAYDLIIIRYV